MNLKKQVGVPIFAIFAQKDELRLLAGGYSSGDLKRK